VDCVVYFDGACEPVNPGGVGTFGFVVYVNGELAHEDNGVVCEPSPDCTNNVAEYTALIRALEWVRDAGCRSVIVRGDSQLVIKQLLGAYSVRSPRLEPLYRRAVELVGVLSARLEWVPRRENEVADRLSKAVYEKYMVTHPEVAETLRKYLATEDQLRLLEKLGIRVSRYISKREASRLIGDALRRPRSPR